MNELLQELSRKQKEALWERLKHLLTQILVDNPVEGWQRMAEEESEDMEVERVPKMEQTTAVMQGVTIVVTGSIPVVDENINYKPLLECALILNGIMYALPGSEKNLLSAIRRLCESWWEKGLEGKEQFGKTAFIMLLNKTLETKAVVVEVYFRAWKKASGEVLEVIEHNCVQDFMHHAIHLPRNSPLHSKVRELLCYFHKQSKCRQGVEEMLYRLYQPILWRALKARNSEIRSNAALLFVDAFPILDPHLNNEDTDHEIQRQFDELFSLLEDPQPLVRSTGVLGVSKIAFKYWEMIPAAVLADLLKKLIEDLAFDVTSADVRCSVFKCLPIILDNLLSHPLLEQLLPALKYNLHDNSEKVRVAFVDMLLKIKAVKAAKFWKICPIEHLLTRLEVDSRPVSRRLVNLLFSSFLPINQSEEVWCERCVTLIQMNPAAARKFYHYAYEYTTPTNIAKLMLTIRGCLNACIQKGSKAHDSGEESEKENISVNNVLSIDDVASMAGLLEVIVILWRSIRKALDHNEEAKNYTIRKFASVLPEYFKVFQDDRCTTPLILLASFMSASAIPTFSCGVISKLRNLENGASENKYSTLIDCLCRWGQVHRWCYINANNNNNNILFVCLMYFSLPTDTHESKPELALDYTEYLLTHLMNRDCLLSLPKEKLNQLLKVLGVSKETLSSCMKATDGRSHSFNQATMLRAFSLYCRLSIHLQDKFSTEGKDYLSILEETGAWVESQVLPTVLIHEQEENISKQSGEVSRQITQMYLAVCKDAVMVGLGNSEFQSQRGYFCIPTLLCVLKEIIEASLTRTVDTNEDVALVMDALPKVFQKSLECVALTLRRQQEEGLQLIHSIQVPLGEFIQAVQCYDLACPEVHHSVLSSLLAAAVVEIGYMLRKASNTEELILPQTFSDLPPLSTLFYKSLLNLSAENSKDLGTVKF
uniref:Non-SMC condensin II complex subunit G2 n=1 Tax=Sphenodon punctatus TaxID=8508 RepID=A0A8D0L9X4_SPHPU